MSAPSYAWACTYPPSYNYDSPIANDTVRNRRKASQEEIARYFAHPGETLVQGWGRAYRKGFRCARVILTLEAPE